jgi:putative glutamine amidotransferase
MKPIIGISVDCLEDKEDSRSGGKLTLNWNYAQAVSEAGGVPILVPPTADMDQIAEIIDGWLIPGGDDIDAKNFGEENHPKVKLQDPARFEAESRLYQAANKQMPIFGICYGCQFVNVLRGGNLIQHLPDVVGHTDHTGGTLQTYDVDGSSKLADVIGSQRIEGKSYHHQAIDRTGQGLRVVARNEDGTVEAIEDEKHPWLVGLQWHPERTLQDPKTRKIFEDFVQAAARFRESKSKVAAAR